MCYLTNTGNVRNLLILPNVKQFNQKFCQKRQSCSIKIRKSRLFAELIFCKFNDESVRSD